MTDGIPHAITTSDDRASLASYLQQMFVTHQMAVARLLSDDVQPSALSEAFEDIGNRFLDLAEIINPPRQVVQVRTALEPPSRDPG